MALGQPRAMVPDDIPRLSALPLHEREGITFSPAAEGSVSALVFLINGMQKLLFGFVKKKKNTSESNWLHILQSNSKFPLNTFLGFNSSTTASQRRLHSSQSGFDTKTILDGEHVCIYTDTENS